jgi:alpha-galactosidase
MSKVTIIGAGSAVFAFEIITDLLLTPALEEGVFALVDIDAERLELAHAHREKLDCGSFNQSRRPA